MPFCCCFWTALGAALVAAFPFLGVVILFAKRFIKHKHK